MHLRIIGGGCRPRDTRHRRNYFDIQGGTFMRISSGFRAALIALTALTGVGLSSAALADERHHPHLR